MRDSEWHGLVKPADGKLTDHEDWAAGEMSGSVLPWSERFLQESSEVSWRNASPSNLGTISSQNAVVDVKRYRLNSQTSLLRHNYGEYVLTCSWCKKGMPNARMSLSRRYSSSKEGVCPPN